MMALAGVGQWRAPQAVKGCVRRNAVAVAVAVAVHGAVLAALLQTGFAPLPKLDAPTLMRTQLTTLALAPAPLSPPPPAPSADAASAASAAPARASATPPVPVAPVAASAVAQPSRPAPARAAPERPTPAPQARQPEHAALARQRVAEQQREQRMRAAQQREQLAQAKAQAAQREQRDQLQRTQARERLQQEQAQRQSAEQAQREASALRAAAARGTTHSQTAESRQYLPLSKEAPDYPPKALDRHLEGDCSVEYTVDSQGRVESPKVLEGCHPLFMRPSLAAAATFRYQPKMVDGRAVPVPGVRNTFHYRIQ
jgi:protein TonB